MQWQVHQGDILDVPAELLICSANVYLTLSGGVGGALMLRYGTAMQQRLNEFLDRRQVRHVAAGEVVAVDGCGSPYRAVLHAVAVDGFYESTVERIADVVGLALSQAAEASAKSVALTALATGYGRKSVSFFGTALRQVVDRSFPPIERVVVGLQYAADVDELTAVLPQLQRI